MQGGFAIKPPGCHVGQTPLETHRVGVMWWYDAAQLLLGRRACVVPERRRAGGDPVFNPVNGSSARLTVCVLSAVGRGEWIR